MKWLIHYHGKCSKESFSVEESSPEGIYNGINYIGTKDNLVFDSVELIE